MKETVPRHTRTGRVGPEALKTLQDRQAQTIRELGQHPHMLPVAFNTASLLLNVQVELDPAGSTLETWEAAVTVMQIGSAMFETMATVGGTVECRINHELLTLPATGLRHFSFAGNWLKAFWLAIVCREQERMTKLCEYPVDQLRKGDVVADEYLYNWIDTLQTYWLEKPGLVDKLISTIELSSPEVATRTPRDMLQQLTYQPINLFYNFFRRNHDGFNEALHEALMHHKAFWTADPDRLEDLDGSLALGPLAMACLARDAGFELDVESGYLPQHLLDPVWTGEFPT
jgi:hypothetical protein